MMDGLEEPDTEGRIQFRQGTIVNDQISNRREGNTMSGCLGRREFLNCSLGTAGLLAGNGLLSTLGASAKNNVGSGVDLSDKAPSSPVAIQRCESFDPKLVRRKMEATLDSIGGVDRLARNKTVTVKVNLTGMEWRPFAGLRVLPDPSPHGGRVMRYPERRGRPPDRDCRKSVLERSVRENHDRSRLGRGGDPVSWRTHGYF